MKRVSIIGGCIFVILLFIPFETTFLPEMTVRVIDENGKPYVGQFVAQYCTNYTLGIHPCEKVDDSSKQTNENGFATFPARKLQASLMYRIIRPVVGLLLLIANGEYGTNASIVAGNSTSTRSVDFRPDGPYPAEIVVPSRDANPEK